MTKDKLNFILKDLDGGAHTLEALLSRDKINLLLFYNNDCLGCVGRALPLAYEFQNTVENLNLVVIHSFLGFKEVTSEDIKNVFVTKEPPFPVYLDNGHQLYDAFECEGTPHWFVADKNLHLAHSIFGSQDGAQLKLDMALRELQHV